MKIRDTVYEMEPGESLIVTAHLDDWATLAGVSLHHLPEFSIRMNVDQAEQIIEDLRESVAKVIKYQEVFCAEDAA